MPDTEHLCQRCAQVSSSITPFPGSLPPRSLYYTTRVPKKPSFVESSTDKPLSLGRPQDWDATCTLCRTFADLATRDLSEGSSDSENGFIHWLIAVDAASAFWGVPGQYDRPRPGGPAALVVMHDKDLENLEGIYQTGHRRRLEPILFSEHKSTPRLRSAFANVDRAKWWLAQCMSSHEQCHRATQMTRLAAAGVMLMACSTGDLVAYQPDIPYLALNYVWSEVDNDSSTLADRQAVLQSPLIRDVSRMTLSLGYGYVWIDRLCIDEGDEKLKMKQIVCMDAIYAGADMTIIAADHIAGSPRRGLSGVVPRPPLPVHTIAGVECYLMPPTPDQSMLRSSWNSRAWTYQESILSKRRLFVLADELYFECSQWSCPELLQDVAMMPFGLQDRMFTRNESGVLASFVPQDDAISHVYNHVRLYCTRTLTHPTDILNAFEGVLRRLGEVYPHIRFLTGLPIEVKNANGETTSLSHKKSQPPEISTGFQVALVGALCWQELGYQRRRRPQFPSWTWAGWYESRLTRGRWTYQPYAIRSAYIRFEDFPRDSEHKHLHISVLHIACPVLRIKDVKNRHITLEYCHIAGLASLKSRWWYHVQAFHDEQHFLLRFQALGGALRFLVLHQDVIDDCITLSGLVAFEVSQGCFERLDFGKCKIYHPEPPVLEALKVNIPIKLV